jgi:hypothetical protein
MLIKHTKKDATKKSYSESSGGIENCQKRRRKSTQTEGEVIY